MNITLIVAGVILVAVGVFRLVSSAKSEDSKQVDTTATVTSQDPEPAGSEAASAPATSSAKSTAKEKGNQFESFVADMLKANSIAIKKWNQGIITENGAHDEEIYNPDFFVAQPRKNTTDLEYWVECKFRSSIPESGFELDEKQVERYKATQSKSKRKVFIMLGLGGEASGPANFFVIPLDSLARYKHIPMKYLEQYELKTPNQTFAPYINNYFIEKVFKK